MNSYELRTGASDQWAGELDRGEYVQPDGRAEILEAFVGENVGIAMCRNNNLQPGV
jgi:hypothetical protein